MDVVAYLTRRGVDLALAQQVDAHLDGHEAVAFDILLAIDQAHTHERA